MPRMLKIKFLSRILQLKIYESNIPFWFPELLSKRQIFDNFNGRINQLMQHPFPVNRFSRKGKTLKASVTKC